MHSRESVQEEFRSKCRNLVAAAPYFLSLRVFIDVETSYDNFCWQVTIYFILNTAGVTLATNDIEVDLKLET